MTQYVKEQYEKIGAVFATADEAWADKRSMYTPETAASTTESNNNALANGILIDPIHAEWDPVTFTLEICKHVTSFDLYVETKTYDGYAVIAQSEEAGWTYLGHIIQDQE